MSDRTDLERAAAGKARPLRPFSPHFVLWGIEVTHMYAPIFEDPNRIRLCLRSCEVPVKQPITDEAKLVGRLRTGDETAFRELIGRYGPRIYRVAYGILRSPDDADDIAQEVFAKVYFSIKSFEGRSTLYTWISRIAINE